MLSRIRLPSLPSLPKRGPRIHPESQDFAEGSEARDTHAAQAALREPDAAQKEALRQINGLVQQAKAAFRSAEADAAATAQDVIGLAVNAARRHKLAGHADVRGVADAMADLVAALCEAAAANKHALAAPYIALMRGLTAAMPRRLLRKPVDLLYAAARRGALMPSLALCLELLEIFPGDESLQDLAAYLVETVATLDDKQIAMQRAPGRGRVASLHSCTLLIDHVPEGASKTWLWAWLWSALIKEMHSGQPPGSMARLLESAHRMAQGNPDEEVRKNCFDQLRAITAAHLEAVLQSPAKTVEEARTFRFLLDCDALVTDRPQLMRMLAKACADPACWGGHPNDPATHRDFRELCCALARERVGDGFRYVTMEHLVRAAARETKAGLPARALLEQAAAICRLTDDDEVRLGEAHSLTAMLCDLGSRTGDVLCFEAAMRIDADRSHVLARLSRHVMGDDAFPLRDIEGFPNGRIALMDRIAVLSFVADPVGQAGLDYPGWLQNKRQILRNEWPGSAPGEITVRVRLASGLVGALAGMVEDYAYMGPNDMTELLAVLERTEAVRPASAKP